MKTLLLAVTLFSSTASAAIVSHTFTATVVERDGLALPVVSVGDSISGLFQYSTFSQDWEGYADNGIFDFEITFNSISFFANTDDLIRVAIGGPATQSGFAFTCMFEPSGSSVISFSGPPGTFGPDFPSSFNLSSLAFKEVEFSYSGYYIRAELTEITSNIVPEPSSIALFSLAFFPLALFWLTRRCSEPLAAACRLLTTDRLFYPHHSRVRTPDRGR